jgi:hypothetical protein
VTPSRDRSAGGDEGERGETEDMPAGASGHAGGAASAAVVPLERGEVLAGRYELGAELGQGARSRVFRAFDRATRTAVAIKVVLSVPGPEHGWMERLGRELRLAREVRHPNLCEVFDLTEADGHRFLIMELALGGTLRDTMLARPDRPWAERLGDVRSVLAGLAAMHGAGIVHRDIKPENVVRIDDSRLALSDFGLAVAPERTTEITVGVGTPIYMAPELLLGAAASPRSDLWSLGLLMHEALFGARPAQRHLAPRPTGPPPQRKERRVRAALARLADWCLHPTPAKRPVDAREVLAAFDAVIAARPLPWRLRLPPVRWAWVGMLALLAGAGLLGGRALRSPRPSQEISVQGQPAPLAGRVRTLAELPGRVHCISPLGDGWLGVVWGRPRRAERLRLATGERSAWELPPESYAAPVLEAPDPITNNCPQIGPDGERLLFAGSSAAGQSGVFLQASRRVAPALLTSGEMPVWHPGGELVALRVDDTHPGIFSLTTGQLSVLPEPRQGPSVVILQLGFEGDGRHLVVRSTDAQAGYDLTRYDLDRFRASEHLAVRPQNPDEILRLTLGAASSDSLLLQAMMPDGRFGLARLDWKTSALRWVGDLAAFDLIASPATASGPQILLARRWTSDIEVLNDGQVSRTIVTGAPLTFFDANAQGDAVIQLDHGSRISVVLYPAAGGAPRTLGPGPCDGSAYFTSDGNGVAFVRGDRRAGRDSIVMCTLEGACRTLVTVPSADMPAVSPTGDRVAYVAWTPYRHVAMVDVATGQTRILGSALFCHPRWAGAHLWIPRGAPDKFSWVELDGATGAPTGRTVPGLDGCDAADAGPDGVLATRARLVHHEVARVLAATGPL